MYDEHSPINPDGTFSKRGLRDAAAQAGAVQAARVADAYQFLSPFGVFSIPDTPPSPSPSAQTAWVRILCLSPGAYGYPGLVQTYNSGPQTYTDTNGDTTTITDSIDAGTQTVTPASMDGITAGSVFLMIDGLCGSQTVTVTSTTDDSFTADFTDDATSYPITGVTITSPGSGYSGSGIPPTVTFSGGGGTGATGTAVLDSSSGDTVASVTMTDNGSGYTSAPTVTFDNSGTSGTGAAGTATVGPAITIYFGGVWVPTNPSFWTAVQNDVDEAIPYFARQEMDAPDGLSVYLAIVGDTVDFSCDDGSSGTIWEGRIVNLVKASS